MAACTHRPCGRVFSGVTAFDRHLRWHKGPPWVSCREPVEVGLVWSEARQAWATHIGPRSVAEPPRMSGQRKHGKSAERPNRSASGAS